MKNVVMIEAACSAVGRRRGGLARVLAPDLLSEVLTGTGTLIERL